MCDAPGGVKKIAECIELMNCVMTAGTTAGASSNYALVLFVHRIILHHQNAVNMVKTLIANRTGCDDIGEDTTEFPLR